MAAEIRKLAARLDGAWLELQVTHPRKSGQRFAKHDTVRLTLAELEELAEKYLPPPNPPGPR